MKPTIKVSIAGYAFVLEDDAYNEINNYLTSLKKHFELKEDGKEIILDVETRISELLRLRISNNIEQVITLKDVLEIIKMIGAPKDMDDSDPSVEQPKIEKEQRFDFRKKRLFRDTEHSVIGGVCSGIAQYLNLDPVLVRVVYVLLFILLGFITGKIRLFLILFYLIAWVIMPKAKTMVQKMQMIGHSPSIDNIENREGVSFNRQRGSQATKVIKIIAGLFLGLISFSLLISMVAIVGVFFGVLAMKDMPSINEVLSVFSIDSMAIKISLILIAILPFIGLVYTTIKLLFQSHIGKRYFVVSGIAFVSWIALLCYVGGYAAVYAERFSNNYTAVETINAETSSDKFYVKLGDTYDNMNSLYLVGDRKVKYRNALAYYTKDNSRYSLIIMPKFVIEQDTALQNVKIEIEKRAFDSDYDGAVMKAKDANFKYELQDSLLIINPPKYTTANHWDRMLYKIIVKVPANKEVVYDSTLLHDKKTKIKVKKNKKKRSVDWDDLDW